MSSQHYPTLINLKLRIYVLQSGVYSSIELSQMLIREGANFISMLEVKLKSKVTKYVPKKIKFGGMYECCEQNPDPHINQS